MAIAPTTAPATSDGLARLIAERSEELFKAPERASAQSQWDDIARFVLPQESSYTEAGPRPGANARQRDLTDSTAPRALELFASSIHSLMNNPAKQWFLLGVEGKETRDLPTAVQRGLHDMSVQLLNLLTSRGMSLYSNLHQAYVSLGAFGTACIYLGDLGEAGAHMREFPMADVAVDESVLGKIDTVFRREQLNLRQLMQRWPDRPAGSFGSSVNQAGQGFQNEAEVIHAVFPKAELGLLRDRSAAPAGAAAGDDWLTRAQAVVHPWLSVWINATDAITLSVGGFEEMPYMVPRWFVARGEIYGRSPGRVAVPDARMGNKMKETILRGGEKLVDPPWLMPSGSLVSPLRVRAGSITYTDGVVSPHALIPPGASRVEYAHDLLMSVQQDIRDAFFTPLFATPDSPVKTATQVLQEADERNRALSPMLIRLQEELFEPLLFRAFRLFARKGMLDTSSVPDSGELDIEYVSPLTAAHKQTEALGAMRAIEGALPWAQVDPSIMDTWEPQRVGQIIHDGSGMPSDALRTRTEKRDVREARDAERRAQEAAALTPAVEAGARVRTADAAMIRALSS